MRRPASRRAARGDQPKPLKDVDYTSLASLGFVVLPNAIYYHREVEVAGHFTGIAFEGHEAYGTFAVAGTKDDELVRVLSGKDSKVISVHLCQDGCGNAVTAEDLVHGQDYVPKKETDEPWLTNLKAVVPALDENRDELAKLREAQRLAEAEEAAKGEEESPKKKKKEKKDKKEKKKDKEKKDKKAKEKKEKKRKKDDETTEESENLERGQKALRAIFKDTGLDPSLKRRNKLVKKARRIGRAKKKKKKKSDGSGSEDSGSTSSESSTDEEVGEGLFETGKRVKIISGRYPGVLACSSLSEAKQVLLTASGTTWQLDKQGLPPLFTHYVRQQLAHSMSPPLLQESLTVAAAIDNLLQGKVAYTCDLLAQRLKSIESLTKGAHWSVGRQHELVGDAQGITEDAENLEAARKAKEVAKLKSLMGSPVGKTDGDSQGKGGKKGKGGWKGQTKSKSDDAGRGKGDGKRGGWQGDRKEKDKT